MILSNCKWGNSMKNDNKKAKNTKENVQNIKIDNEELEKALKETITIEKEFKEGKRLGYNNAKEMLYSIIND